VTSQDLSDAGASDRANIDSEAPLRFGRFAILRQARRLFMDGQVCEIGGRAFDLLMVLIDRRGKVVSKREIIDLVWPDTYVDDVNLRVQIVTLRKALGADRDIVKAVPGRGYMFTAEVLAMSGKSDGGELPVEEAEPDPAAARINFTRPLHALLGRAAQLAELETMIGKSRMVTLTGCGGVGKTRFAIELGLRLASSSPDRISLIELAPLQDRASIISTTAAVLGVEIRSPEAAIAAIAGAIGQRQLLIFDNCEHLVEDVNEFVGELLERAPGLTVLATSQEPLHHPSGSLYRLEPLAIPPLGVVDISGFAAAALFCERARSADRRFKLTAANTDQVAQICRRLDGIPLALEMAAARLSLLGTEGLLAALDARLKVLKTPARIDDARHQTLRSMVEWSHGLLDTDERRVFRRLAIFPSSFSLEAAAEVAGEKGEDYWDPVDTLGRLVEKSLVTVQGTDPPRYLLLETLRLYATEKLREAGETDAHAERHARHFIELFDEAEDNWEKTPDPDWIARYQPELDNLRAALGWALAVPERRQIALALAASGLVLLRWLWFIGEGCDYLGRILPLVDADIPPAIAARLFGYAAIFFVLTFDPRGLECAERAVTLYRDQGDRPGLGAALVTLAQYRLLKQQYSEAKELLGEARDLLAGSGMRKSQIKLMGTVSRVTRFAGDIAATRRSHSEALELARALKSQYAPVLLSELGALEYVSGNLDRAIELTREALDRPSSPFGGGRDSSILGNLGTYLITKGAVAEARPVLEKALSILIEKREVEPHLCLRPWALLVGLEGRLPEAAQLYGYIEADRARRERPADPGQLIGEKQLIEILSAGLPPDELQAWQAMGAEWSDAEAIAFAANRLVGAPKGHQPVSPR